MSNVYKRVLFNDGKLCLQEQKAKAVEEMASIEAKIKELGDKQKEVTFMLLQQYESV